MDYLPSDDAALLDVENGRMLVVAEHPLTRRGIMAVLGEVRWVELCGAAATAPAARQLQAETGAHWAILDLDMPDAPGLLRDFRRAESPLQVIGLSCEEEIAAVQRAFRGGASGYVSKYDPENELARALGAVMQGQRFLGWRIQGKFLRLDGEGESVGTPAPDILSGRERDVLRMIGGGAGPTAIAQKLHLSVKTVETHQRRIREKLGLRSAEALRKAAARWVANGHGA